MNPFKSSNFRCCGHGRPWPECRVRLPSKPRDDGARGVFWCGKGARCIFFPLNKGFLMVFAGQVWIQVRLKFIYPKLFHRLDRIPRSTQELFRDDKWLSFQQAMFDYWRVLPGTMRCFARSWQSWPMDYGLVKIFRWIGKLWFHTCIWYK